MMDGGCQRWRHGRDSYRPAGETIATRLYEVAEISGNGSDRTARAFVEAHHYSGSYPSALRRFGLYRTGELVGVLVVSVPMPQAATPFPGERMQSPDLGRFVLLDDVPANGETWFLARCVELMRGDGLLGLVSLSDPAERRNAAGVVVFAGHVGTIYQASNAIYLGRGPRRTLRMFADGTMMNARAISKIRARSRGWRYASALLEARGADALGSDEDAAAWLRRWLSALTTTTRHPGHHRYAITIDRRVRRHLPMSVAYPKARLDESRLAA